VVLDSEFSARGTRGELTILFNAIMPSLEFSIAERQLSIARRASAYLYRLCISIYVSMPLRLRSHTVEIDRVLNTYRRPTKIWLRDMGEGVSEDEIKTGINTHNKK
jgi:hypothetical protein